MGYLPILPGMDAHIVELILKAGWCGFIAGVVSGAIIGLYFHREDWMGGYNSYRRRMVRLGHISFFGLGILNVLFGLTLGAAHFSEKWIPLAAWSMIIGAITMPTCCFLSAWRKPFRHLFIIPVWSVLNGITFLLYSWRSA